MAITRKLKDEPLYDELRAAIVKKLETLTKDRDVKVTVSGTENKTIRITHEHDHLPNHKMTWSVDHYIVYWEYVIGKDKKELKHTAKYSIWSVEDAKIFVRIYRDSLLLAPRRARAVA